MRRSTKWTMAAGLAGTCAALGTAIWLTAERAADDRANPTAEVASPRFIDGRHLPVPSSVPAPEVQVANVIQMWREAIIAQHADAVLDCDQIFRDQPERYGPALVESARTDADPRVRAFSTRVLGKIADPAHAPVFEALVADQSRFVRQNAAWALGRLRRPESLALLERVQRQDDADNVRVAASRAIAVISGEPTGQR